MTPARDTATLSESFTEMSEILMPNDTNNLGRALGGSVLHWMDICAAISARRFSRRQVVTAATSHVDFANAIDLGDIVVVTGYVFATGDTSVDVQIEVRAQRPERDSHRRAATAQFTMVALDESERPTAVPELVCPTANQEALREEALANGAAASTEPVGGEAP
jgi:acyl-CoA hydrolase